MKTEIIPKGSIFILTSGYDISMESCCRAKHDINIASVLSQYLKKYPEQRKREWLNEEQFLSWFVYENNHCDVFPFFEVNIDLDRVYCNKYEIKGQYTDADD